MLYPIQILDLQVNINEANLERLGYESALELQNALDDVLISLSLLHKVDVVERDKENYVLWIDTVDKIFITELKFQMTFKDANLYSIIFSKKQMAETHRKPPVRVFFEYKIKERPLDRVKEYILGER